MLTGRAAWLVLVLAVLLSGAVMGAVGQNDSAGSAPVSLPPGSESAQMQALLAQFPDADSAPALAVLTRVDGGPLTAADLAAAAQVGQRMAAVTAGQDPTPAPPPAPSPDGRAVLVQTPVDGSVSGFALRDLVADLRAAAADGLDPALAVQVTGGPAFGADIADSFSGANTTLLAVTALVVAALLVLTYRSPVLWLVPLAVVAVADRVAVTVGTAVAEATGLTFDGSTSGITSVLVFGAGTNYALLLVSRYREELHREHDHRVALARAWRRAGPAILASNATVVLALLTLLLSDLPSIRSLGALAACGLLVAAAFALLVLPAALAVCGRRLFWPFVPKVGEHLDVTGNAWYRVADAVARRPAAAAAAATAALLVCAAGLVGAQVGIPQTEQFRVAAESVEGYRTLAEHFPAGAANPTVVVAPAAKAARVQALLDGVDGVVSTRPTGESGTGLARWAVVLDAAPASGRSGELVDALRAALAPVDGAVVGGADAQARDIGRAAAHSRVLLVPTILAVVLAVLFVLLRAVVAPLVLVGATVLSAFAALGAGAWISTHLLGFPALDTNVPLFAFLFLVALGVDYTIFLVTRAREETPAHGTQVGMVRAVAATGGVITSAGVVLAAVFCVLGVLPLITLTQLGVIVGLGILLDTFVVRTLLIPAVFTLVGPRIWWPVRLDPGAEAPVSAHPTPKETVG